MNNENTLLNLGFTHYPDWDFKETGSKHYRFDYGGKLFRAYVQNSNDPVYVIIGEVVNEGKGLVKRWKDCVSSGSVKRFIEKTINSNNL